MRGGIKLTLVLAIAVASSTAAVAGENATYTYDARGRLIKVTRDKPATPVTGPSNDVQVCYVLDRAGNRSRVKADVNINIAVPPACPP